MPGNVKETNVEAVDATRFSTSVSGVVALDVVAGVVCESLVLTDLRRRLVGCSDGGGDGRTRQNFEGSEKKGFRISAKSVTV
jgi:hypothetical protein